MKMLLTVALIVLQMLALLVMFSDASPTDPVADLNPVMELVTYNLRATHRPMPDRLDAAWGLIEPLLDVQEFTHRALLPQWDGLSTVDRAEVVELVRVFLHRAVFSQLKMYKDQEVRLTNAVVDGTSATVNGYVRGNGLTDLVLVTRYTDGRWRIVDIQADGISFLANYRAQFQRLIRLEGITGLKAGLREKGKP